MLKDRLQALIDERGLTVRGAAVAAGLQQDYLRNILRGKSAHPSAQGLEALAQFFGVTVDWLMSDSAAPAKGHRVDLVALPVRNRVRAGVWTEAGLTQEPIGLAPIVPDSRYPDQDQWAELVEGKSMDLVFPPGSFAHCLDATGLDLGDKSYVIVERLRGDLVERSLRQLIRRAGFPPQLVSRSSVARLNRALDDAAAQIVARVIGCYVPL